MKTINRNNTVLAITLFLFLWTAQTASAFYSPNLQRWVNRDPIGERGFELTRRASSRKHSDGTGSYVFIENDPVNRLDPWGLFSLGISWVEKVPCTPAELEGCYWDCWPNDSNPVCWDLLVAVPGDPQNPDIIGHGVNCNCSEPPSRRPVPVPEPVPLPVPRPVFRKPLTPIYQCH